MRTIECRAIEKPVKQFSCEVLRSASNMRYQDASDGKWKPIQSERVENWMVLAETIEGAQKVAEYHFYNSKNIIVKEK